MANLRREFVRKLLRWLLACSRNGLIPKGLSYTILGGAVLAMGQSKEPPIRTCYKPVANMGPYIINFTAEPNPTQGADTVRVKAVIVDSRGDNRSVSRAVLYVKEYYLADDGQHGIPMKPLDGAFDSSYETAYLDLDVSEFPPGTLKIYAVGWDEEGTRGKTTPLDLEISE